MAKSPAHKFGQIIGDLLEDIVGSLLSKFAIDNSLYLDKKGNRRARNGLKVTWKDLDDNKHDLDFVLEEGGSDDLIGTPVAFIEVAWRRYTKHSKNKAQEIQGAILPLVSKYSERTPFIGTILAGEFTDGAIRQLKSLGFTVLYFSYADMLLAFKTVGLNAYSDEGTPDDEISNKIEDWEILTQEQKKKVSEFLLINNKDQINEFMKTLQIMVKRQITTIEILPLHGIKYEFKSIEQAAIFIERYTENDLYPFIKFEINISYSNGDHMKYSYSSKEMALRALYSLLPSV